MLELLKKIGVPATVAAVIAALVTMVPVLFTVDERYAKSSDLKEHVKKLEAANSDLRQELAQTVGFQQAMIALIQQGKINRPTSFFDDESPRIMKVQYRVIAPAEAASAASAPASAASSATPPKEAPTKETPPKAVLKRSVEPSARVNQEKPQNWKDLSEGLMRQQQRLMKE